MKRREFCIRVGGTLVAIPAVLHVAGCGGDDDDDNVDAGPATSFEGTGSNPTHSHTFTVQCSDLSSNSDITYTSTSTDHSHQVTLTVAQLGDLAAGIMLTFSTTDMHDHSWTVVKPTTACS